jgi:hypothetical protein
MQDPIGTSIQHYLYQPSTSTVELCGVEVVSYTPFIDGGEHYDSIQEDWEFVVVCPDESVREVGISYDKYNEYQDIVSEFVRLLGE